MKMKTLRFSPVLIAFLLFLTMCAWIGGSSRNDVVHLLVLRPATVIFLGFFVIAATRDQVRPLAGLLILLALFAATMLLQLAAFSATPSSGPAALASADMLWSRTSISPDRTWNSVIALLIPLTALIGVAALGKAREHLILIMLGLILASALFGVFNMLAGTQASFSMYEQFNENTPSGFLANRNHQAALVALGLPLLRVWSLEPSGRGWGLPRTAIAFAIAIFLGFLVLILGSRAGIVLLVLGIVAALIVCPPRFQSHLPRWGKWMAIGGGCAMLIGLVTLTYGLGRAQSLDRLVEFGSDEVELRLANLPAMISLLRDTLPFGSGFGSFDPAFRVVEPNALLRPTYFNNAHNDLLELAITGGVPALLVLIAFVLWWGSTSVAVFRAGPNVGIYAARAGSAAIAILLVASLFDYPLRTPLLAAVFAMCCGLLALGRKSSL